MKSFLSLAALFLLPNSVNAEDYITYLNGDKIAVKVIEVNKGVVKYRKISNPDGPIYSESTKSISKINYENGSEDVWNHESYTHRIFQSSIPRLELQFKISAPCCMDLPQVDFVLGLRFNDYFRVGLGIGVTKKIYSYNSHSEFPAISVGNKVISEPKTIDFDPEEHTILMPIFANLKYTFLDAKLSPYIQTNLGYYVYKDESEVFDPGFFGNISLGLDWRIKQNVLFFEMGYEINSVDLLAKPDDSKYTRFTMNKSNGLSFGLGYSYTF